MIDLASGTTVDESTDELPRTSRTARTRARVGLLLFAALAYVPLLLTDTGKIDADSKAYLYLDPGRLLSSAASLWDPRIGMGTISYQMIGFLFPVGPYYWITEHLLGVPPWVAERLWLGTLIFAAGLGTRYLLRVLGLRGPGVAVGMLAYAFTPYAIQFSSHTSVLLGPWAGMPWMTAFVVLALRRGGWKYPALLAITVQLTGSVNASTLVFALLAPALWIPYAVVLAREVDWRRALSVVWRSALLIVLTSWWWATALVVESAYGRNVLRFTEQPVTTSATLYPVEVLRGLGYWIFYYREGNGPVGGAAATFMRNPTVLFVSIFVAAVALLAATAVRWSYRAYFVLLVLVGVALSVGSSSNGGSSPFASAYQSFSATSTVGFALRNSARAVPLVALGLACLLAAGVSSLARWLEEHERKGAAVVVFAIVAVLLLVDAPGVWGRSYYDPSLEWRSIPAYWKQAATLLDAKSHDTRVLALPGSPFAAYTWGTTQDPVEPGLMTRPFATIEQIPWGSDATANLLSAIDVPLQAGQLEPASLAPLARLMGVGDLLLDMDLQTNRYGLVPADSLWRLLGARPVPGLDAPAGFGTRVGGAATLAMGDVARPAGSPPPQLAVLPVRQSLGILRTSPAADPLVVDGDGAGLVGMAGAGVLDARRLVLYSASFQHEPAVLRGLPPGAALVVTDSNRKQPYWSTSLTKSYGPTEQAGAGSLRKSPYDQRLDVFPGATSSAQTVTLVRGVKSVEATSGYQVFNLPATRPSLVFDGNVYTGWTVDAGAHVVGPERLRIEFTKPITTDQVNVMQPLDDGHQGRWITRVTLRFDGHDVVHSDLDYSSRSLLGQTLHFPKRTFSTLEIRIDAVHHVAGLPYDAVGLQEIRVADDTPYAKPVSVQEDTRMPLDLLQALGSSSLDHPLSFVVTRDAMDDFAMNRQIWLPTARSFTLTGTVAPGAHAGDAELDQLFGIAGASAGGVTASASTRYDDVLARASSAIDADLSTAWTTPIGVADGSLQVTTPRNVSFDHMNLSLVDDGRHSLPTSLRIDSNDGSSRNVDLARFRHTPGPDGTVAVPITFAAISGHTFTITITHFYPVVGKTADYPAGILLPSGIAELGIPGVRRAPMSANVSARCLSDVLAVDGRPFPVRLTGTTAAALQSQPLTLQSCDGRALRLSAGVHEISAAESPVSPSGVDVQHLVLASGASGTTALPVTAGNGVPADGTGPSIRVAHQTSTSITLHVDAASKPYWLVLGQSYNRGWVAKADGRKLGEPTLVDGYANGWLVRPGASGKPTTITLEWTPQRRVRNALLISALALVASFGIAGGALLRERRRRRLLTFTGAAPPTLRPRPAVRPSDRRRGAVIGTVLAATIAAGLFVRPWLGPIVGVIVLLALLRPRWRWVLRVAPATLVAATAVYVTVGQVTRNHPAVFQWPSYFSPTRILVWIALILLGSDALIAVVWRTDFQDAAASPNAP